MRRVLTCSTVLVALVLGGGLSHEGAASSIGAPAVRPSEVGACRQALDSRDAGERLHAVRELSGWALDGRYRKEALGLLELARFDTESAVALQAEVALASLTGGDREAVRAAYGVAPPDPAKLTVEALGAKTPEERSRALVVLGRWHGEAEIATLLAATRDPSPIVRLQALELLWEIAGDGSKDPRLVDALRHAENDPEPAIRSFAERTVRSLE